MKSTIKQENSWCDRYLQLSGETLKKEISLLNRLQIIDWLQWNDPNGIYVDKQSREELGRIMTRKEGIEIMTRQIEDLEHRHSLAFSKFLTKELSEILQRR